MAPLHYLILRVGALQAGLPLHQVERAFPAVAIAPAPAGPAILLGLADVAGTWVPVADFAMRLGQGSTLIRTSQVFILVRTARRRLIMVADGVLGEREFPREDFVPRQEVAPGAGTVEGMVRLQGDAVWIQDVDRFLAWEEEQGIEAVLAASRTDSSGAPDR